MLLSPWIVAARPRTLVAAVIPIVVAISLVWRDGTTPRLELCVTLLVAAIAIQIATNLFNDAIDYRRGADQKRSGPPRATQSGLLSYNSVYRGAFLMLAIAVAAGIPLVLQGGWPILAIGVLSLFLAYAYTGGRYAIAYVGLGELFVFLFFGVLAVSGSYWVLRLAFSPFAMLAGAQIGCFSVALLLVNNIRDLESDRVANKRTLVSRLGRKGGINELSFFLLLPFLLSPLWIPYSAVATWLPCLTLPLAVMVWMHTSRAQNTRDFAVALALSAKLLIVFGGMLSIGIASIS